MPKTLSPALKWGLRLFLGLLILAFLLSKRDTFSSLISTWRGVSPLTILGAIGFYWLGQLLCVWKWQMLLKSRGENVGFGALARIYGAGMFGNLWLPTNVGGDALRTTLLHQSAPNLGLANAAASIFVERLTGFFALLVLAILGVVMYGAQQNATQIVWTGALIFTLLVGFCALVLRLPHPKIQKIRAALGFYLEPQNRGVLAWALLLSLLFQISQTLLNIGLARAVSLNLPGAIFWWLAPTLSLSGLVPAGIGGLGVREAAAVGLAGQLAPHGTILAWSLLWQATVWGASLPGVLFLKKRP